MSFDSATTSARDASGIGGFVPASLFPLSTSAQAIAVGKRIGANLRPPSAPIMGRTEVAPPASLADRTPSRQLDREILIGSDMGPPSHVHPLQWEQAIGIARDACAQAFRDGGTPGDAVQRFRLAADIASGWDQAVRAIAHHMCARC